MPEDFSVWHSMVVQVWAATFIAVAFSVLVELLRQQSKKKASMHMPAYCTRRCTSGFARKVRYVLSYPLPPRPLCAWVTGGAVSVADLLVMTSWAALALMGTYSKLASHLTPDEVVEKRLKVMARAIGTATRAQLALALLPVPRSNFLAWLLPEAEFSMLIKYHRWMGWGLLFTYSLHSAAYSFVWLGGIGIWQGLKAKMVNVFGLVALLAGLSISLTASSWIRRTNYQLFYRVHVIGAPVFLLALFIHDRMSAFFCGPAILLVVLDRVHRTWADVNNCTSVSASQGSLALEGSSIVTFKLAWNEAVALNGGETLFLTVPTVSRFMSHPFSVADVTPIPQQYSLSSQPHSKVTGGQVVTLYLKVTGGSWTSAIRAHAVLKPNEPLPLQVEGPYESGLRAVPQSPVVVLIAGGIGITPLLSLLRRWSRQHAHTQHVSSQQPQQQQHLEQQQEQHDCWQRHQCRSCPGGVIQDGMQTAELGQQQGFELPGQDKGAAQEGCKTGGCEWDLESLRPVSKSSMRRPYAAALNPHTKPTPCASQGHVGDNCSSCALQGCGGALYSCHTGNSQGCGGAMRSCHTDASESPVQNACSSSCDTHPAPLPPPCAVASDAPPPSLVYLSFSCKSLDELQLLGPELLDAAYGSGPNWLHLFISYTGFELEAAKVCAMCDEEGQCLMRPAPDAPPHPTCSASKLAALKENKLCSANKSGTPAAQLAALEEAEGYVSFNEVPPLPSKTVSSSGEEERQFGPICTTSRRCCSAGSNQSTGGVQGSGVQDQRSCTGCDQRGCTQGGAAEGLAGVGSEAVGASIAGLAGSTVIAGSRGAAEAGGDGTANADNREAAAAGRNRPKPCCITSGWGHSVPWLKCPPSRQPFFYFACACLAFGGAFVCLMSFAFPALTYITAAKYIHGPIPKGIVLLVLLVGGAAFPPAFLLWIFHTVCWPLQELPKLLYKDCSLQEPLLLSCSIDGSSDQQGHIAVQPSSIRVLNGYELDWDTRPRGKRVRICRGRPLLMAFLSEIQQLHSTNQLQRDTGHKLSHEGPMARMGMGASDVKSDLIPVLIGGPELMWVSSQEACWQLNIAAAAFLEPHRVAHVH